MLLMTILLLLPPPPPVAVAVKYTLEQAMQAKRGSRGITILFLYNFGTRSGWVVNATPRPLYPRETDP
jgi:hypothetical protein